MLRRTTTFLKVSPYMLFMKDLSNAGKLSGVRNSGKYAATQYRKLTPTQKAALVKRANATTFSSAKAHSRMAKREMRRTDTPVKQRYAELRRKWAVVKAAQKKTAKPKTAKSKVKKAGKKAKSGRKASA